MFRKEDFYRLAAEHVSDIVLVMRDDMEIEFCTPSVKQLFGYSPQEITGTLISEYVHPEDWPETRHSLEQAARNPGHEFLIQCRAMGKEGAVRTMESLGKTVADGTSRSYFVVVARDVTASLRASEQMRKLFRAVEQSPAVIIITDKAGNIDYVNPKFSEVTGYTPGEVLGTNPRFLKSGETSDEEYRRMWTLINRGEEYRGELRNKKKNDNSYWASVVMSAIKDDQGKITHYLSVQEDITEKKELERQLEQAQQLENIALLASGVAHDLNNVLAPIMMGSQALEPHCQDPHAQRLLSMMNASARRATAIVQQVLAFAKGSTRQGTMAPIKHLARNAVETLRQVFPKNILIHTNLPSDLSQVTMAPIHCEQILLNLAINARDAMPEGGNLTIAARNCPVETLPERFRPHAKADWYVLLSIEDSGSGVPDNIRERIFEPFFTTKGPEQGSGLGLNIVKRILDDCGGFIDVRSRPGEGTTFELYLPAASGTTVEEGTETMQDEPKANRELILFVDDEEVIREVTAQMLELKGYEVITAKNGAEALMLIGNRPHEIKLLITDLVMPILSGEELIRSAKRLRPELKVLVLTGSDVNEDEATLSDLQADRLIKKPFSTPNLYSAIKSLMKWAPNSDAEM